MEKSLRIAGVQHDSIVDGPGMRFAVFTQGCPHHCRGCHNPETWSFEGAGVDVSVETLVREAMRSPLTTGVTLSGGEPFCQPRPLASFAAKMKAAGKEVAAYSGFTYEQIFADDEKKVLLTNIDILVDGKFDEAQKNLEEKFRGSMNQRVINVPASLSAGAVVLETSDRWV